MKSFFKYFVPAIEIIWWLLFTMYIWILVSDKYFDTQFKENLSQNRYVSHFLGLESEEQFEVVDRSDPFFIALKENISQVIELEQIETIKVQNISENEKKFYITTKKHHLSSTTEGLSSTTEGKKTFLVQKNWETFKVSIKK